MPSIFDYSAHYQQAACFVLMTNYLAPILFVSTPYIGGVWGSLVTKSQMKWYDSLKKPKFTPPKWLFGPMWTLLYGCMGTASYLVWRDAPSGQAKLPLAIYGIHLLLNWSWSHVFFGAHKLKTVRTLFAMMIYEYHADYMLS
ncbi:unnamed protein product, partial [Protopolystoma xenopodis]